MPVSKTEQWVDWALQKAEGLPVVGDRIAEYRQERHWQQPGALADHAEWMTKVVAENDRLDRINGNPGEITSQWELAVGNSGLGVRAAAETIDLFRKFENEFSKMEPGHVTNIIENTIDSARQREEARTTENQMSLFTTVMLRDAQPLDRERGLQLLEDLAVSMKQAEENLAADLQEPDILEPWNRVDDQMELVCADRNALMVAAEWGYKPDAAHSMLLSDKDMNLQSADLFAQIQLTRELDRSMTEKDYAREEMSAEEFRDVYGEDEQMDFAEAYADVAGDATLAHRLENEDPRDILNDVKAQAHREAGLGDTRDFGQQPSWPDTGR